MSKPLSALKHVPREPYTRAVISEFGGYVQVPVPAGVYTQTSRADPARVARVTLNPQKEAAGHAYMDTREYGTGAPYTFRQRVGGVMPGYAGHRPGSREVHNKMAFGGVPTFNPPQLRRPPGQGMALDNRPATSFHEIGRGWKDEEPGDSRTDSFRDRVGGVLVGYTGFVPNARTHCGGAHVGGLSQVGQRGRSAQRGHHGSVERLQGDRELSLSARTERACRAPPGYAGHVPRAMGSFGMSHFRNQAPDPRKNQSELYSA